MNIFFDIAELYYLPQFLPVYYELKNRGANCSFIFYGMNDMEDILEKIVEKEQLPVKRAKSREDGLSIYKDASPDWIIFGNNCSFLSELPKKTKSALLYHGIGVKSCYFDANLMEMDIRFVEGEYRYNKLSKLYPNASMENVGFAKLDPLFSNDISKIEPFDLEKAGLDKNKPTLLYAPTFYPSSIERLDDKFPHDFKEYNLIIKPHFFSLSKKKYQKQREKISLWEGYENTYIATALDYSLIPFMKISDILISEASSAFFEFAALDKPIVWLDILKLRWGYKGIFKYRFNKRMDADIEKYRDIGIHAPDYKNLNNIVRSQIEHPDQYKKQRNRYVKELIGNTDGKVSERIVDYLEKN